MQTKLGQTYNLFLIPAILFTAWLFAFESARPAWIIPHLNWLRVIDQVILGIFTLEFIVRILFFSSRWQYVRSIDGLVDFLAIAPSLIGLLFYSAPEMAWLRSLRLLRLSKIVKLGRFRLAVGGVTARTVPLILFCFSAKAIFIAIESQSWWSPPTELNLSLGVVGFGVAALLGAKLSVVNGRIFAIEDAVCRLVGALRHLWGIEPLQKSLVDWSLHLERFIEAPREEKLRLASNMRDRIDGLEAIFTQHGITGPNLAGFHRDASFLIHRATATTPRPYDQFLKITVITYLAVILMVVPGVPGLIASMMSSLVLGGMLYLVEDMDDPLSFVESSYIDARIDPLKYWNSKHASQYFEDQS